MSASDKTIDPRLLEKAAKEFREKGFEKASLRKICRDADVTTGALYKRFKGKEELFSALVDDTVKFIFECADSKNKMSKTPQSEEMLVACWELNEELILEWFKSIVARRESMELLLMCSSGTKYENFEHELASIMSEANYRFYKQAYDRGITKKVVTEMDLHIIDSSFWKTITEPLVHGYSWEEIEVMAKHVCSFMNYYNLLGISPELVEKYKGISMKTIGAMISEKSGK